MEVALRAPHAGTAAAHVDLRCPRAPRSGQPRDYTWLGALSRDDCGKLPVDQADKANRSCQPAADHSVVGGKRLDELFPMILAVGSSGSCERSGAGSSHGCSTTSAGPRTSTACGGRNSCVRCCMPKQLPSRRHALARRRCFWDMIGHAGQVAPWDGRPASTTLTAHRYQSRPLEGHRDLVTASQLGR